MRRTTTLAVCIATMSLSACGDEPGTPKSTEDIVSEAGNLVKQRPGRYTSTTKLIDFQVPGLPESQAEQIRSMSGEMMGQETSFCLTQAEVDKGMEDTVRKLGEGAGNLQCAFTEFEADGNDLNAKMSCNGANGVNANMVMDGNVQPESSSMKLEMTSKVPQLPQGEMRVVMQVSAERTGDCS